MSHNRDGNVSLSKILTLRQQINELQQELDLACSHIFHMPHLAHQAAQF